MSYEYGPQYMFRPSKLHAMTGCAGCTGLSGTAGSFTPKIPYDFPRYYFDPHMDGYQGFGAGILGPMQASVAGAPAANCQSTDTFLNFLAGAIDRRLPVKVSVPFLGTVPSLEHIKAGVTPIVNAFLPQVQKALTTGRDGLIAFFSGILAPNLAGSIAVETGASKYGLEETVKSALLNMLKSQTQSIIDEFMKLCQPTKFDIGLIQMQVLTPAAPTAAPTDPAEVYQEAQALLAVAQQQNNQQAIAFIVQALAAAQNGMATADAQLRIARATEAEALLDQAENLLYAPGAGIPMITAQPLAPVAPSGGGGGVALAAGAGLLALLLLRR